MKKNRWLYFSRGNLVSWWYELNHDNHNDLDDDNDDHDDDNDDYDDDNDDYDDVQSCVM